MEYLILNNGIKMPQIGFGVYQISAKETKQRVLQAINAGYRHIDTANYYGNEKGVGDALKSCQLDRDELFITTKIYGGGGYKGACAKIEESLRNIQSDYIDLVLIHWPSGNNVATYQALEEYYRRGKIKAIGLSNFYGRDLQDILNNCTIKPMVNQIEAHVYFAQSDFVARMAKKNIQVVAWSPLACGNNNIFHDRTLQEIAKIHNKTVAQVALRFLTQQNYAVIPKTTKETRMVENIDLFDFNLSDDQIRMIENLDTGESQFGWY